MTLRQLSLLGLAAFNLISGLIQNHFGNPQFGSIFLTAAVVVAAFFLWDVWSGKP